MKAPPQACQQNIFGILVAPQINTWGQTFWPSSHENMSWAPGLPLGYSTDRQYAAVVSRVWAKASACRLQIRLHCRMQSSAISCRSSTHLHRSSLHRLAGLSCRIFLSYGLQVATREVHRSSLRRLICPVQRTINLIFQC